METSPPIVLNTYGIENPGKPLKTQLCYDRYAFAYRTPEADLGMTRYQLFQKIADAILPGWFEWHAWTEKIITSLCERRWVGISGCSNSAKTRNTAGFAAVWWLCDPDCSSVIFCSTTMKALRKRGWAEIQSAYRASGGDFGHFVDSRTTWQRVQGDDRNAIFAIAVTEGSTDDAAANIQGIHTKRQLVIIDEAEAVPAAIWKAAANLYPYPVDAGGEFVLGALANPRSRLSQFGRFIEPEFGWDKVSVETEEWESKPQYDGQRAIVIRLDFKKSPNLMSDKPVSKHLPNKARVSARLKALELKGAENDPDHWCYDRGFPPPEGLSQTVFTESMIMLHKGMEKHIFNGQKFRIIGAFDQARTGDRPTVRFAAFGEIRSGVIGIELLPAITLFADITSKDPIAYQFMAKLREHCGKVQYRNMTYQCSPDGFGIDCSNEATFGDLCQRDWDPRVIRIHFSAAASEGPVSNEDPRPCKDVYRNKRAEMFFQARNALSSGQLRGIDPDTAAELCTMEYSELRPDGTAKLITIQDKKEYKLKFTKSPDLADSGIMILEVARRFGFEIVATGYTVTRETEIKKMVEVAQNVYEPESFYSHGNEDGQFEDDYDTALEA